MSEVSDCLREVRSWMTFLGWEDGGGPGSVKKIASGIVVARHGDATWIRDCDASVGQIQKERDAERAREALRILTNRDNQQSANNRSEP